VAIGLYYVTFSGNTISSYDMQTLYWCAAWIKQCKGDLGWQTALMIELH